MISSLYFGHVYIIQPGSELYGGRLYGGRLYGGTLPTYGYGGAFIKIQTLRRNLQNADSTANV